MSWWRNLFGGGARPEETMRLTRRVMDLFAEGKSDEDAERTLFREGVPVEPSPLDRGGGAAGAAADPRRIGGDLEIRGLVRAPPGAAGHGGARSRGPRAAGGRWLAVPWLPPQHAIGARRERRPPGRDRGSARLAGRAPGRQGRRRGCVAHRAACDRAARVPAGGADRTVGGGEARRRSRAAMPPCSRIGSGSSRAVRSATGPSSIGMPTAR